MKMFKKNDFKAIFDLSIHKIKFSKFVKLLKIKFDSRLK